MISNIGKSTRHVSCLYSEGKAIKPNNLKLVAKYSHATSNLKNWLAGSGGDCRNGQGRSPTQVNISAGGHWQGEHCAMGEHCPRSRGLPGERRKPNIWRILNGQQGSQKNHSAKPSDFHPPGDKRLHTGPQFAQTCDDLHTWRWLFCRSEHQQKYKHSGPQTEQNCEICEINCWLGLLRNFFI